jgi:hypothetical protein
MSFSNLRLRIMLPQVGFMYADISNFGEETLIPPKIPYRDANKTLRC